MNSKRKTFAVTLSIISNSSLVCFKLIVGILSGSVAIVSEAIHSGIDLLAALIAFTAVTINKKPPDAEHPYGHGKFENISGTIEALLIFIAALWIIYEAIDKLINPKQIEQLELGVIVMLFSTIVNIFVSRYLMKTGKETDSIAIIADAWHLRTDVFTSIGVMFAMAIIWSGKQFFPSINLYWIDPLAAIMVAILIAHAAWKLTIQSSKDLVDSSLPNNEVKWIKNYLQSLTPTVCGFHNLRTRKSGAERFIEVHIAIDGDMSVNKSYELTKEITKKINTHFTNANITIHIEPCNCKAPNKKCSIKCRDGCLLNHPYNSVKP